MLMQVFFKIDNHSGEATITNALGIYSEIEIDSGTINNARCFNAIVDINGGTLNESYMFRGSISGTPTSNNFGLYLIGVSHNRVDGFLGVGKTPSVPLDVFSDENIIARFNSSDSVCQLQISDDDTTFYFGVLDGVAFISDTAGGPASGLQVDGSGNVGIGIAPTEKLHVSGDALVSGDVMADAYKPAASSDPIKFKNSSSTELVRITDGGNVGIGTITPQSKADINGTLRVIGQATPSGGAGLEIGYSGAGKLRAIDRATTTYKLLDFIASKFTFKIDGTEKMRLSDDGRLGISTSTPETELDVNGTCTSQLLQLKRQDETPSEPETDKSIIFMDSSGDIKVLINVGGTTVTRTLATYA